MMEYHTLINTVKINSMDDINKKLDILLNDLKGSIYDDDP